jgi:hypothetical protein
MKKYIYLLICLLCFACNSEDAGDCFQTSGNIIQKEIPIESFNKILVNRDIELIVKDGPEYKVIIETGENLINDVEAVVLNQVLELTDYNTCNYVRDYGITKIYVTAPNLTEIRSSTQYDISSDGILNFDTLQLVSEDFNALGTFTVGDFRVQVNSNQIRAVANNISSFYLTGETENLYVGFFSGAGRFQGETLIAQHIEVFHRGSNDMIVNPQQSISGEIRSTGNVIALNQPPLIEVESFYTGELIFD